MTETHNVQQETIMTVHYEMILPRADRWPGDERGRPAYGLVEGCL